MCFLPICPQYSSHPRPPCPTITWVTCSYRNGDRPKLINYLIQAVHKAVVESVDTWKVQVFVGQIAGLCIAPTPDALFRRDCKRCIESLNLGGQWYIFGNVWLRSVQQRSDMFTVVECMKNQVKVKVKISLFQNNIVQHWIFTSSK